MQEFMDVLSELDEGKVDAALTQGLNEVIISAMENDGIGKIKLEVSVKKMNGMAVVTAKVTKTLPQPRNEATAFWSNDDGELFRHNPRQPPLKNLDITPPHKLRKVGTEDKGE